MSTRTVTTQSRARRRTSPSASAPSSSTHRKEYGSDSVSLAIRAQPPSRGFPARPLVQASGSATVQGVDFATVQRVGLSHRPADSATVQAWDLPPVQAWGSGGPPPGVDSTVRADSAGTVSGRRSTPPSRASGSATVQGVGLSHRPGGKPSHRPGVDPGHRPGVGLSQDRSSGAQGHRPGRVTPLRRAWDRPPSSVGASATVEASGLSSATGPGGSGSGHRRERGGSATVEGVDLGHRPGVGLSHCRGLSHRPGVGLFRHPVEAWTQPPSSVGAPATVEASKWVAVHLFARATVSGGFSS